MKKSMIERYAQLSLKVGIGGIDFIRKISPKALKCLTSLHEAFLTTNELSEIEQSLIFTYFIHHISVGLNSYSMAEEDFENFNNALIENAPKIVFIIGSKKSDAKDVV